LNDVDHARFDAMLQNERSFDELFCDVIESKDFSIFYNAEFAEDPVFNHVVLSSRILDIDLDEVSIERILNKIQAESEKLGVPSSIFADPIRKSAAKLERAAVDFGYRVGEKMDVMSKAVSDKIVVSSRRVKVVETKDIQQWNKTFIDSFAIPPSWEEELLKRENSFLNDPQIKLLVAIEEEGRAEKELASGCLLLHINPPSCAGIYCVGTVPDRRSKGIASSLMSKAESMADGNRCKLLTLQTIKSDGVTPMYLKMGYKVEFERDILQQV